MINARIAGVASYVPDDILDNEMLSKMVDTSDEWITTRVGVKERRILKKEGEGSSYMGIQAVNRLLEKTGTKPEEVDLLICATSTPTTASPPPVQSLPTAAVWATHTPTTFRLLAQVASWPSRMAPPTSSRDSARKW